MAHTQLQRENARKVRLQNLSEEVPSWVREPEHPRVVTQLEIGAHVLTARCL